MRLSVSKWPCGEMNHTYKQVSAGFSVHIVNTRHHSANTSGKEDLTSVLLLCKHDTNAKLEHIKLSQHAMQTALHLLLFHPFLAPCSYSVSPIETLKMKLYELLKNVSSFLGVSGMSVISFMSGLH